MSHLNKDQLRKIAYGACFLASGGGGGLEMSLSLVDSLPDNFEVEVKRVEDIIDSDKKTAVVAYMGAPAAGVSLYGAEAAIHAFKKLNEMNNGKIGFVIPVEIGALSSIVACVVAGKLNLPVIDADGAGRAVPELTMLTFSGYGVSPNPSVLSDNKGETVVIEVETVGQVESIARSIIDSPSFKELAGLAMWPMDGLTLHNAAPIRGTLTLAENVGNVLLSEEDNKINAVIDFLESQDMKVYRLFEGLLRKTTTSESGGFDVGQVIVQEQGSMNRVTLYFQNENLMAWDSNKSSSIAMAPDSICYLTSDGRPFSNADIDDYLIDKEVILIGIASNEELRGGKIMNSFKTALCNIGYAGCYVPIEEIFTGNDMEK